MQNFTKFFGAFLIFSILAPTALAYQDYFEGWEIASFHSEINLEKNGTADIKETINADFTNEAHAGLARFIPFKTTLENGDESSVDLEFLSSTDENGTPWDITEYEEGDFLVIESRTLDSLQVNEPLVFNIEYLAKKIILFFDTYDEFYWNVNGTENPVPTKEVSATVNFPQKMNPKEVRLACHTGYYGDTGQDCDWEINENSVTFKATRELAAYEGLSIVIGLPKGTISPPPFYEKILEFIENYWPVFLPIIAFILMFLKWYASGRDEKTLKTTIIPHYKAPKDLSATETGIIIDEKMHPRDLTATIIDFAIKGYIKINEIEEKKLFGKKIDYELELLKPYETEKEFEKLVLAGIFLTNKTGEKIKISNLNYKFYKHIPGIEKSVMNQLVKDDFFPHNPSRVRQTYAGIAGGFAFVAVVFGEFLNGWLIFGILSSAAIVGIFGQFMAKKTKKGAETYYELKGLYEYINTAEKDRMKFQEKNNIIFEKLLPYAMAFGLIEKWTKAFDGLITSPPSWYNPAHPWRPGYFYMHSFGENLSSAVSNMATNFASKPGGRGGGAFGGHSGFGGGGFSGGGFGGGGSRGL